MNAVFANKIAELPTEEERRAFVEQKRAEYRRDIDIYRLASELIVDDIVAPSRLREELIARLAAYATKDRRFVDRRHGVPPV